MSSKTENSIEQREYLKPYMPTLSSSELYEEPHFAQLVIPLSESFTSLHELSREQIAHLATACTQWLKNNPEDTK